jgi:hypothetical protein
LIRPERLLVEHDGAARIELAKIEHLDCGWILSFSSARRRGERVAAVAGQERNDLGEPSISRLLTKGVHDGPSLTSEHAARIILWLEAERADF